MLLVPFVISLGMLICFFFLPLLIVGVMNWLDKKYCERNFYVYSNMFAKLTKNEDRILIDQITKNVSVYAIFDGSNGAGCSEYWSSATVPFLKKMIHDTTDLHDEKFQQDLIDLFVEEDKIWIAKFPENGSGTSFALLIRNKKLRKGITVTLGDPEIIIQFLGDEKCTVVSENLTWEHESEQQRIKTYYPNVPLVTENGIFYIKPFQGNNFFVRMSRSLGKSNYRGFPYPEIAGEEIPATAENQLISSVPRIKNIYFSEMQQVHWILLASRGLWKVLPKNEVRNFINQTLKKQTRYTPQLDNLTLKKAISRCDDIDKFFQKAVQGKIGIVNGLVAWALSKGSCWDISAILLF